MSLSNGDICDVEDICNGCKYYISGTQVIFSLNIYKIIEFV